MAVSEGYSIVSFNPYSSKLLKCLILRVNNGISVTKAVAAIIMSAL